MSSKRFKGKTCAYCALPESSTDGEHVLAKSFVLERHRADLPKVPACKACNNEKSKLETELTAVLPFGGRHSNAIEALNSEVPAKLEKNLRLKREIGASMKETWVFENGVLVKTATIHIDSEKFSRWIVLLARGLSFHHWGLAFDNEYQLQFIAPARPEILRELFDRNAHRKVSLRTIGGGALTYQGSLAQNPTAAAWRFIVYGGIALAGDRPEASTQEFGVFITRKNRTAVAAE